MVGNELLNVGRCDLCCHFEFIYDLLSSNHPVCLQVGTNEVLSLLLKPRHSSITGPMSHTVSTSHDSANFGPSTDMLNTG